jgi:hypothetical protein
VAAVQREVHDCEFTERDDDQQTAGEEQVLQWACSSSSSVERATRMA